MGRSVSMRGWLLVVMVCLFPVAADAARGQAAPAATSAERLQLLERAVTDDPENLTLAADYRQVAIGVGQFDRAINFLEKLAKRRNGPNVRISQALAYVDKVPVVGDIRRLYLGRDAIAALTQSIALRPCVLAYYMRGLINLYYNRVIFHRADKGVADLTQALSMITPTTPRALVVRVYIALGDGYYRMENFPKARENWLAGAALFPEDADLRLRLGKSIEENSSVVGRALEPERRVDTSLTMFLPID